jgi:hypothetical protein
LDSIAKQREKTGERGQSLPCWMESIDSLGIFFSGAGLIASLIGWQIGYPRAFRFLNQATKVT